MLTFILHPLAKRLYSFVLSYLPLKGNCVLIHKVPNAKTAAMWVWAFD